ncbi:hypothetical protein GCM10007425_07480 [Lysinibacillus alkalisoli]|uniref:AAA+ ATPase domain-containing protein n=1 Tax=Lysinibacillus alkalisoli TaxID=1911548 RepID=A0A917G0B9_9BACI|nr:AAA family ATPase [Lysinibacillus alkalisoli]GGG15667.1 hypothetical protein GCM10007425_07480 [Lysinibacillus alkalisoli]
MENKQLFYPNGKLKYEGMLRKNEFGHDLYHGMGKLYDESGGLLYEGAFYEQAKQGEGAMFLKGELRYKGQFLRNQKHGHGELYQDGFLYYRGEFKNDQMDGYGELFYPRDTQLYYKGQFIQGMRKGEGMMYYPNGRIMYVGEFMWQNRQGFGKLYEDNEASELLYEGYYFDDMRHGKGILYEQGIKVAEGQFKENVMQGEGVLYYPSGAKKYEGQIEGAVAHGRGDYFTEDGKLIYSGEFVNGERLRITPEIEAQIARLKHEMHALVGLDDVKAEVDQLINFIKMQGIRVDYGLASFPMTYHLVFTGNPGTGKTTVARIIGQLYKYLGVLSSGHFVETDRAGLVAGYVGQTALKVQDVVKKATGGVLFIDEAYALVNDKNDAFGQEAIDSLLKAMEDLRDDLVIIVAGYEERMQHFLQANPGFKSRFNRFIAFPNYRHEELFEIFARLCEINDYQFNEAFQQRMQQEISQIPIDAITNFSNGRYVRNLFEKLVTMQSNRLANVKQLTREDVMTLTVEDIEMAIQLQLFEKTY